MKTPKGKAPYILMANFKDSPHFSTHNDYYTPISAWKNIQHLLDAKGTKKIFESFLLNSNEQSKNNLKTLGYEVIGNKNVNFLDENTWTQEIKNKDYDIILSNPPFERIKSYKSRKENLKYKCIKKLFDNDKPFIILMNSTNMFQKWFMELVEGKDVNFIFPSKKIQYDKYKEGGIEKIEMEKNSCSFNSIYVCYKVLDKNEWI
mgnify:CR=1 FL=1|tara:strand:+ start:145 stop:756 length:612 start_codon:yes stop_codon:yes gene_type:complete